MAEPETIEVIETPLAFHGGPELAQSRPRRVPCDDIAAVFADTTHGAHGWNPLCILELFGGEQITVVLPDAESRRAAHAASLELASNYRHYLPAELDAGAGVDTDDGAGLHRVCAGCGSHIARTTHLEGSAS